MAASASSPVLTRSRRPSIWTVVSGLLLAWQLALLAGCGATDDRSDGSASSIQSAPSAQETVNGSSSTTLPPSPATSHPVDPSHNPATLTPQSTGPTAPAP